ncbi:glycosyltransferase family 4 protein [Fulvivirgaceae bacterium PWU4]|uniref:Glycosyltransferase family 4 protein n=1 Tax=Chryseosolibacter histidini TaxID=2782349 RepID=A0AAP2GLF7_9BACT|nr:glycosyltransferase family 4 protein [Chryseosolibacter histidini]MBT1700341.1 glycosyltransferase family 4 protein [Chryseosolibacter histidini]
MKLLISAYACIPHRGSEPGVGWNWTLEHARLGHEVWCITTPDGREAIEQELKKHHTLNLHFIYVPSPAWANWLYRFQPFVYFHYLLWQYNAAQVARRADKLVNFDLVLHITLSSFQLGSGFWRLNKPMIFGPVGGGNFAPRAFKKYFGASWLMEVLRRRTSDLLLRFNPDIRKVCRQARLILVANRDTLRMARRYSAGDIRIFLDSGLSEDFFNGSIQPRPSGKMLKILWVGRIFARKGLPLVLEALSLVQVPFHLTILGNGKSGSKVPRWIRQYQLERKVSWLGQVSWEAARQAYLEHDVFLLCSLRDSFGSQFMEAMAYGLPIITLDHQGAGDHIPDECGIKVPVTTPAETVGAVARAVAFMYHNPEKRLAFGRHGYHFARTQTWTEKVKKISRLYNTIAGINGPQAPVGKYESHS